MAATDQAIDGIRELIASGEFRAGDRLPKENELAARIGVSRGSLREAIRALELVGVVDARQGAGTYLTSLTPALLLDVMSVVLDFTQDESILQLLEIRRVLEPAATALAAARATDQELEDVRAAMDAMRRARDPSRWSRPTPRSTPRSRMPPGTPRWRRCSTTCRARRSERGCGTRSRSSGRGRRPRQSTNASWPRSTRAIPTSHTPRARSTSPASRNGCAAPSSGAGSGSSSACVGAALVAGPRPRRRLGPAAHLELAEDVMDVVLDGGELDTELAGDLLVRQTVVDQADTCRSRVVSTIAAAGGDGRPRACRPPQQRGRDARSAQQLPVLDGLERVQQSRQLALARHDRRRARLRTVDDPVVGLGYSRTRPRAAGAAPRNSRTARRTSTVVVSTSARSGRSLRMSATAAAAVAAVNATSKRSSWASAVASPSRYIRTWETMATRTNVLDSALRALVRRRSTGEPNRRMWCRRKRTGAEIRIGGSADGPVRRGSKLIPMAHCDAPREGRHSECSDPAARPRHRHAQAASRPRRTARRRAARHGARPGARPELSPDDPDVVVCGAGGRDLLARRAHLKVLGIDEGGRACLYELREHTVLIAGTCRPSRSSTRSARTQGGAPDGPAQRSGLRRARGYRPRASARNARGAGQPRACGAERPRRVRRAAATSPRARSSAASSTRGPSSTVKEDTVDAARRRRGGRHQALVGADRARPARGGRAAAGARRRSASAVRGAGRCAATSRSPSPTSSSRARTRARASSRRSRSTLTSTASAATLVDSAFMEGSLDWFEVVDDPPRPNFAPSDWAYDAEQERIVQRAATYGRRAGEHEREQAGHLPRAARTPSRPPVAGPDPEGAPALGRRAGDRPRLPLRRRRQLLLPPAQPGTQLPHAREEGRRRVREPAAARTRRRPPASTLGRTLPGQGRRPRRRRSSAYLDEQLVLAAAAIRPPRPGPRRPHDIPQPRRLLPRLVLKEMLNGRDIRARQPGRPRHLRAGPGGGPDRRGRRLDGQHRHRRHGRDRARRPTQLLSGYAEAVAAFGAYDKFARQGKHNLSRAIEIAYRNGAGIVFARAVAADAGDDDYTAAFESLIKEDVNILIAPRALTTDEGEDDPRRRCSNTAENNQKDMIAVIGTDETAVADINGAGPRERADHLRRARDPGLRRGRQGHGRRCPAPTPPRRSRGC